MPKVEIPYPDKKEYFYVSWIGKSIALSDKEFKCGKKFYQLDQAKSYLEGLKYCQEFQETHTEEECVNNDLYNEIVEEQLYGGRIEKIKGLFKYILKGQKLE